MLQYNNDRTNLDAAIAEFNQLTETIKNDEIDFVGIDKQKPVVTNRIMKQTLRRIGLLSSEWMGFLNTMVVKSIKQQ